MEKSEMGWAKPTQSKHCSSYQTLVHAVQRIIVDRLVVCKSSDLCFQPAFHLVEEMSELQRELKDAGEGALTHFGISRQHLCHRVLDRRLVRLGALQVGDGLER